MLIADDNRMSRVSSCLDAAAHFLLSREEAIAIVEGQITCIINHWDAVCEEAALSIADRVLLWGRQFLNPYTFDDLVGNAARLKAMAEELRV